MIPLNTASNERNHRKTDKEIEFPSQGTAFAEKIPVATKNVSNYLPQCNAYLPQCKT